jgi:hypothetical protein
MTTPSTARKAGPLLGNGVTTTFPFAFKVFAAGDIQVTVANSAGVETLLVLSIDYSVALNVNQDTSPGGTVTYPLSGSALPVGSKLSIIGDLDYDQPYDIPSGGNFSPLALENQLDRTVMQIQQIKERSDRALVLPVTASADTDLPSPEAQKLIGWDVNGTGLQNYDIPDLFSGAVYADWLADTFTGTGTQTVFVLQRAPGAVGNCDVSVDGQTYVPNVDFTLSGNTVAFTVAPINGAEILVRYGSAASQVSSTFSTERRVATAGQTLFTLTSVIYAPGANALAVYVNGIRYTSGVDYLETDSDEVTFTSGLTLGDEVLFVAGRTLNDGVGAEQVSFLPAGTGAVARTAQAKMRESVSVKDFGAVGDGVTNDYLSIQAAINATNSSGGGKVFFPAGKYNIGSSGLVVYQNIILQGDVTRYGGGTTRGTSVIYTGSGNAIYGENILDLQILDLDIDCTASTGVYPSGRGIWLNGVWKSTLRNVTVRGVTPAKGYSIVFETNPDAFGPPSPANAWGGQHNYLEQVETSDGTILFYGTGGSDGVTTTVCNTIRGYQYEIVSSQLVFINSTAEGSSGIGFDFYGAGCFGLMLGCDIEGTLSPGIRIDNLAEVREVGTIWAGFTGATRVSGNMASVRSYGGEWRWIRTLTAATAVRTAGWQDANAEYLADYIYPENVTGGSQSGYRYWERRISGTTFVDHNWRQHAFVEKAISTSSTAAATIFTIPITNGTGLRISAHAQGLQSGDNWYSNARECLVVNAGGTLTITSGAQLTAGSGCAISFSASGTNLLVQWTPTTANASTGNMNLEIRGPWTSYT